MTKDILLGKIQGIKAIKDKFPNGGTMAEFKTVMDIEPAKKGLMKFGLLLELKDVKKGGSKGRKAQVYDICTWWLDFNNRVEMAYNYKPEKQDKPVEKAAPKVEPESVVEAAEPKKEDKHIDKEDMFPSMEEALTYLKRCCPKGVKITIEIVGE